ncbi:Parkinson disease protein 7 homolog [Artemia franciscana]
MAKTCLVLLAEGSEETEVVASVDTLRRAEINVTLASLHGKDPVTCSRGVIIVPDASLDDIDDEAVYDVILVPGGLKGVENLSQSPKVARLLKNHEKRGSIIAAICAGPLCLMTHSIGLGKKVTSHPSVQDKLVAGGYQYSEQIACKDGKIITSRGPGTAINFALLIIHELLSPEVCEKIAKFMVMQPVDYSAF